MLLLFIIIIIIVIIIITYAGSFSNNDELIDYLILSYSRLSILYDLSNYIPNLYIFTEMAKFQQFSMLMWKNVTLMKRSKFSTFVEILLPTFFSFMLIFIRSKVRPVMPPQPAPPNRNTRPGDFSPGDEFDELERIRRLPAAKWVVPDARYVLLPAVASLLLARHEFHS